MAITFSNQVSPHKASVVSLEAQNITGWNLITYLENRRVIKHKCGIHGFG